ncbi:sulfite exporter TauE/SafE family protein [Aquimarina hainanensis]|uniref:Sulfite exporter TauE/SafE family protein n=1 Tax=Aquimarina hainanensis TaxID=1578017 RepID=A0ABW5N301_9FLAO|nr:sulfite exporter TauE/SafE family protein [Aquimarina sp. TRL1]QKX07543.1 sulfite exporter TauE/SafE family protein [Aquimarina sp. TRL1]
MLVAALILGFLGSFHCIGMCGPIAFMLPVDRNNSLKKVFQIFLYHSGRLLSYTIIGVFFGVLGKSLYLFGIQQKLSIIIGVLMVLFVLLPDRLLAKYNISKPVFSIIGKVKNALGKELKKKSNDTFLTIGFLNGFLPCGLVYMAVFGAIATGGIVEGALYMTSFGIGTIPLMTATVYISRFLSGNIRRHILKAIPVFVVIIGLLFIIRGLGLGIPYLSPKAVTEVVSSNFECYK